MKIWEYLPDHLRVNARKTLGQLHLYDLVFGAEIRANTLKSYIQCKIRDIL